MPTSSQTSLAEAFTHLYECMRQSPAESWSRILRDLSRTNDAFASPMLKSFLDECAHSIRRGGATALLQTALGRARNGPIADVARSLLVHARLSLLRVGVPETPSTPPWTRTLDPHRFPIRAAIHGDQLLTIDSDGILRTFDLEDGTPVDRWRVRDADRNGPVAFVGADRCATGGMDGSLCLWELGSGTIVWQHREHRLPVLSLALGPTNTILSLAEDRTVALTDVETGCLRRRVSTPAQQIHALYDHERGVFYTIGSRGAVSSWAGDSLELLGTVPIDLAYPLGAAVVGSMLVVLDHDSLARLPLPVSERTVTATEKLPLRVASFSAEPDAGRLFLGSFDDGSVNQWNVSTRDVARRFFGQAHRVSAVFRSARWLVSVGHTVRAFDLANASAFEANPSGEAILSFLEVGEQRFLGVAIDGGFASHVLVPDAKYLLDYDPLPVNQAATPL